MAIVQGDWNVIVTEDFNSCCFCLSNPTSRIIPSPSVNSPTKWREGFIGERVASKPDIVAWSSVVVTLLGDRGVGFCCLGTFVEVLG